MKWSEHNFLNAQRKRASDADKIRQEKPSVIHAIPLKVILDVLYLVLLVEDYTTKLKFFL